MIPYGRQSIDEEDIRNVVEALESDWLTTGPLVQRFEDEFASVTGSLFAVSLSSGTAALHGAMNAAQIGPGDEVIVPAITFVATSNAVIYEGGTPVFVDVDPDTLLLDPKQVREKITDRTRAIVAVDFGGQPCDYESLREIADEYGLILIADACHSLGAIYRGKPVGTLADLNCFSFHPVKPITTGEGGMVTTKSPRLAERIKRFRSHGIDRDFRQRTQAACHRYDMVELGYNYRLTDLQSALGLSQLGRLNHFTLRRNELAAQYDHLLKGIHGVEPLARAPGATHAFHLYVVKIGEDSGANRDQVFQAMRRQEIGVNVHYRPVYLNSYYRNELEILPGLCPQAEKVYAEILSLPMYPTMTEADLLRVVDILGVSLNAKNLAA